MKLISAVSRYPEVADPTAAATEELESWLPPELPLDGIRQEGEFLVAEILTLTDRKAPEGWAWEHEFNAESLQIAIQAIQRAVVVCLRCGIEGPVPADKRTVSEMECECGLAYVLMASPGHASVAIQQYRAALRAQNDARISADLLALKIQAVNIELLACTRKLDPGNQAVMDPVFTALTGPLVDE